MPQYFNSIDFSEFSRFEIWHTDLDKTSINILNSTRNPELAFMDLRPRDDNSESVEMAQSKSDLPFNPWSIRFSMIGGSEIPD
jgi:hypothetical protein